MNKIAYIGIYKTFIKGFIVTYLLYLPILLNQNVITPFEVGSLGFALMLGTIINSILLSVISDKFTRKTLLTVAMTLIFIATTVFTFIQSTTILYGIYFIAGLGIGIGINVLDEISSLYTEQGKRFKAIGTITMLQDITRIIYPTIIGVIFTFFAFIGIKLFLLATYGITFIMFLIFLEKLNLEQFDSTTDEYINPIVLLKNNKDFAFNAFLEFLDSFGSSQLFVYLPTLLVSKNFNIESAVAFQSIIFAGYFSGRWLISRFASRSSGYFALTVTEIGMAITVMLLVFFPPSVLYYPLFFILGIFTRGTSPVIKALVLDSLNKKEQRQGTPIYGFMGDFGGGVSQLVFGFALSIFGIVSPFVISSLTVLCISILAFTRRLNHID